MCVKFDKTTVDTERYLCFCSGLFYSSFTKSRNDETETITSGGQTRIQLRPTPSGVGLSYCGSLCVLLYKGVSKEISIAASTGVRDWMNGSNFRGRI